MGEELIPRLSNLSLEIDNAPGRIEVSVEGTWIKVSLVFEKVMHVAEGQDFKFSIGLTWWVRPMDDDPRPHAVPMESYDALIYNIRTLQGKVSYEENWAPLGVSAAILIILVLAVATQNPETVKNLAEKFWEFVIKWYEGLLRAQPQLTPRLAH